MSNQTIDDLRNKIPTFVKQVASNKAKHKLQDMGLLEKEYQPRPPLTREESIVNFIGAVYEPFQEDK